MKKKISPYKSQQRKNQYKALTGVIGAFLAGGYVYYYFKHSPQFQIVDLLILSIVFCVGIYSFFLYSNNADGPGAPQNMVGATVSKGFFWVTIIVLICVLAALYFSVFSGIVTP